ncbi:MAG: tRNA (adenosine(37)-N6)-dimethylallyltransferase MiaA [Caulobacteraceae bacterium]|nr:tRNA (adenosine(37)-N6)-dimethylallyltransferase MiaA [Caulobacteraceae bacterium]
MEAMEAMARMEVSPGRPAIVLIAGPTASGKSALALRLAQAVGGAVVGADALQLYADLRLITARPSPEEEAQAPHHLFGVADAAEGWSVGRWLRAANAVLEEIAARGRPAILVGGTGLYFRALTLGLAPTPQVPAATRDSAGAKFDRLGEAAFRVRLASADPQAEARIAPGDRQRLIRAWSVLEATGRSLSDWQAEAEGALPPGSWRAVALTPPREALYARCDARLEAMLREGALAEVEALMARGLDPGLPAMKAVGYREFAAHLAGETTLADALAAAQRETRRYAKRQMTWLRGQLPSWPRIEASAPQDQWAQFLALHPALTG